MAEACVIAPPRPDGVDSRPQVPPLCDTDEIPGEQLLELLESCDPVEDATGVVDAAQSSRDDTAAVDGRRLRRGSKRKAAARDADASGSRETGTRSPECVRKVRARLETNAASVRKDKGKEKERDPTPAPVRAHEAAADSRTRSRASRASLGSDDVSPDDDIDEIGECDADGGGDVREPRDDDGPRAGLVPRERPARDASGNGRVIRDDDGEELDFRLVFNQPDHLRHMFKVLGQVLGDFPVCVECAPGGFRGILIETVDSRDMCVVIARLSCSVEVTDGADDFFCVAAPAINHLLQLVSGESSLHIFRRTADPDVLHLRAFTSTNVMEDISARLPTVERERPDTTLAAMTHRYSIDLDHMVFHQLIRYADLTKATEIEFHVQQPAPEVGDDDSFADRLPDGTPTDRPIHTFVDLALQGGPGALAIETVKRFHCLTQIHRNDPTEAGSFYIETVDQPNNMLSKDLLERLQTKYRDRFLVSYLKDITARMARKVIRISLSDGLPMLLRYPLGGDEESAIEFVLAPKAPEV